MAVRSKPTPKATCRPWTTGARTSPSSLAERDELKLGDEHWQVLRWIRDYYAENGTAPNLRVMSKMIGGDLGEQFSDKKYLFDLFPYGPAKQAARYAGMPKPTGCV
jgi:TusE/DsrC/DsvC family sulfur relay protein